MGKVQNLRALRTALRSVGHDQEMSLVGHLDELRTRLLVSLAVIGVAFGLCFWQNGRLLHIINAPLAHQTTEQIRHGNGPLGQAYETQRSARDLAVQVRSLVEVVGSQTRPGPDRRPLRRSGRRLATTSSGFRRHRRATVRSRSGSASRSPPR